MPALLDVHSYFSFGAGASSPEALVRRARLLGYDALALTDELGVYGAVALWREAQRQGLKPLVGATVPLRHEGERYPLVLLALSRDGYEGMNRLLTRVHASEDGAAGLAEVQEHAPDLALLTGGRDGFPARLLGARRYRAAEALARELAGAYGDRLHVQLFHDRYPNDGRRARALRGFARDLGLAAVAAPQVRYAEPGLYPLYDALCCGRLGIDVDTPHPERPRNDAQHLIAPEELRARLPFPDALENAERLAARAELDLLAEALVPPRARVPHGMSADEYLAAETTRRLRERYPAAEQARAREVLAKELALIERYGFADFFLVAAEVAEYCRSRGILAAGRGSAAGSVVCYLLGVTRAEPIRHGLLFERFLHTGMTSFPDVDIDIASGRRDEVLRWVEERFGAETEAMVCNRITYRLPLAIQDLGRALGLPPELRTRLTKALGRDHRHLAPRHARTAQAVFDEVLGDAPVKEVLLGLLEAMEPGFVRHVAPHSGGVVLSRRPLARHSPLQRSSGGIRLLQFDKDDIEALGLIKLDLLGLRMLGALERAREEIHRLDGRWVDLDDLPDEPGLWEAIGRGDTLGLFQIESPSQMRTSVELKPRSLRDLAHQVALIRPGPIQSGTVHPYLRRRKGLEPVTYLHPSLRPVLEETYGVILFQEQILRIARHVAGMSWPEADRFRKKVSGFRDLEDIEPARRRFVDGVRATVGATEAEAEAIFEAVKAFQGYGFAESHAWAFALHAYASAWLRHHHPAEYLAAVFEEHPGMWPLGTLREEAKRRGVPLLRLDVNASGAAWRAERDEDGVKALRPPLHAVKGVTAAVGRELVLARLAGGPFRSLGDLLDRAPLALDALEPLLRAGALDRLGARRELLFELRGRRETARPGQGRLFERAPAEAPRLARLELRERVEWDRRLKGFSEIAAHPLDLMRRELLDLGATPLATVRPGRVRTAGLVVARQKPPTAKGFAFFMLEDGPARAQLVISPQLWEAERAALRDAAVLLVDGVASPAGQNLQLRAERLWGVVGAARVEGYRYG